MAHAIQQVSVLVSWCVPQPLFKALADLWCGLQEEAELLKVLHTIMLNLQPFTVAQAELFPAEYLDGLLEGSEVKTDQDRLSQPSGAGFLGSAEGWVLLTYYKTGVKFLGCVY